MLLAPFYFKKLLLPPPHYSLSIIRLSRDAVAEGGTLAEEVIATVRTAQAFGTQAKLGALYDDNVRKALAVDARAAIFQGQLRFLLHCSPLFLPFMKPPSNLAS